RAKGWVVEYSRSADKKHTRVVTITPAPYEDGTQTSETSERPKPNGGNRMRVRTIWRTMHPLLPLIVRTSSHRPTATHCFYRGADVRTFRTMFSRPPGVGSVPTAASPTRRPKLAPGSAVACRLRGYWAREHEANDIPF